MSHGRKERTPAQLAVLAQAREKAKIVIAERAKLNAHAKTVAETEPLTEDVARAAEAVSGELIGIRRSTGPPLCFLGSEEGRRKNFRIMHINMIL